MAHRTWRRSAPGRNGTGAVWLAGLIVSATASPARAAIDFLFSASAGLLADSNPLERNASALPVRLPSGKTVSDDFNSQLTANLVVDYGQNGPLEFNLGGLYRKVDSYRIDTLDRVNYQVGGRAGWNPGELFDLAVRASQARDDVGLADIGGQQAAQQTTRLADATIRVRPFARWQLSLTPAWQQLELPQPASPEFSLEETAGSAGVDYLGTGPLVPGVVFRRARGRYSGIVNATRYDETTIQGTLNYKVTDFSAFSLLAGHTRRDTQLRVPSADPVAQAVVGARSAFTGSLTYTRQFTPKTSGSIGAIRDFQQYDAGVNTALGTGFNGALTWNATSKLAVTGSSRFLWSKIEGLRITVPVQNRTDLLRTHALTVTYAATRRLSVRTYATRSQRNSTVRAALFNRTVGGVDLTITFD